MTTTTKLLDQLIPVSKGRFADAVGLGIDTPMRYSEFFVELADGRQCRLRDRRQLVGWSGQGPRLSLYFKTRNGLLRLRCNRSRRRLIRSVDLLENYRLERGLDATDAAIAELRGPVEQITATDGGLLFVAAEPRRETATAPLMPIAAGAAGLRAQLSFG